MTGYGHEIKMQKYRIQGANRWNYTAYWGYILKFILVRTLGFSEGMKLE